MGGECIVISYAIGLAPLAFGLYVIIVGRVYLTSMSKEPVTGIKACVLGCFCVVVAMVYYSAITWAWSFYDR